MVPQKILPGQFNNLLKVLLRIIRIEGFLCCGFASPIAFHSRLAILLGMARIVRFGLTGTATIAPLFHSEERLPTLRTRLIFKPEMAHITDWDLFNAFIWSGLSCLFGVFQ